MRIEVADVSAHVAVLELRMPFHFGNVAVTEIPHVFLEAEVAVDESTRSGISMGGLIPMWFYKDPDMPYEDGLTTMAEVFSTVGSFAEDVDATDSPFAFWEALYQRARDWGEGVHPPLVWNYGVSMVEAALLDAVCRSHELTFSEGVRKNIFGIELGHIYEELEGMSPGELLPTNPSTDIAIRHTVGQTDPLTEDEIRSKDRLNDGLPQALSEYVVTDGVRHLKIKLSGDGDVDADRLAAIDEVMTDLGVSEYKFTADANESFGSATSFRDGWEQIESDPRLETALENLLYVEQPLARDQAFSEETKHVLSEWEQCPPVIIDESDGLLRSAGRALEYGYVGTSHKNCKGIFKGIANACLIANRNRLDPEQEYVISAEDLTTIGPIELFQDLAVVATIGVDHVERNGHHYFRGLDAFDESIQKQILDSHGDLYRRHDEGFPTLAVDEGRISLHSVLDAPFGVKPKFDMSEYERLESWMGSL